MTYAFIRSLWRRAVALALLLPFATLALAAVPSDATPASAAADERVHEDLQGALSSLGSSGALGAHPDQAAVRVDEPARRLASLGALVDSTSGQRAQDGLHVLGATPGSAADRIGLRPGDVIVAVNGTSLRGLGSDDRGHALASATLRNVVASLPDEAPLELQIARGGAQLTLSGSVQAVYLPAMQVELGAAAAAATSSASPAAEAPASPGCGRISVFDVAPRGERLYAAKILLLDGSTPGPRGTPSFRVSPGEHHLLVSENIPTEALGIGTMASLRRNTNKPLTVIVKPGTTTLVAARLHLANAGDLSHGTYWDPVVWKEIPENCP